MRCGAQEEVGGMKLGDYEVRFAWAGRDTFAMAFGKETGAAAVVGVTTRSLKDEHNPKTGKKLALARAMSALGLDREQRKALWAEYLGKVGR
jgi:hypothetical protein